MRKEDVVPAAEKKMYGQCLLALEAAITEQQFPDRKSEFKKSTAQMIDKVMQDPNVPFQLGVSPKGGAHAMGLLFHTPAFYVLEPNFGLYKFPTDEAAARELNNHFVRILPEKSTWQLTKIRL